MLKRFLRGKILFLEKIFSAKQRKEISILLGIVIPVGIQFLEEFFPHHEVYSWLAMTVIEIILPGAIICLLWDEIGRLRSDAQTDKLTGLYNRRGATDILIEEIRKRQQALRGILVPFPRFGIIGIDLDDFKKVNDTFGHSAGDRVLIIITQIINSVFNRTESHSDINCRNGGDEFLVILANTTIEMTRTRAEVLRKAIADDVRLHFGSFNVTASIGVASLEGIGETSREEEAKASIHNAIMAADRSTYISKKSGKNNVA